MIKTIKVSHESRTLSLGKAGTYGLGVENDNLYDTLYFEFDELVDGVGELLTSLEDSEGNYVAFPLTKEENGYSIVVTNSMLTVDQFNIQLMVTSGEVVWHSVMAKIKVKPCIEVGEGEIPSAVDVWLETADAKLGEVEDAIEQATNVNAMVSKLGTVSTITITDKYGVDHNVNVLDGVDGEKGEKGDTGETGPQGPKGDKGDTGEQGPQGIQGPAGATGPKGDKGDKGEKGDAGATGATGPAGATGPKGDKGDKGDTGETGPQGPQGETGPQGPKGDPGETPDLSTYVKKTDYANAFSAGVIYPGNSAMVGNDGKIYCAKLTNSNYNSAGDNTFISKGTFENVMMNRNYASVTYVDSAISSAIGNALGGSY